MRRLLVGFAVLSMLLLGAAQALASDGGPIRPNSNAHRGAMAR